MAFKGFFPTPDDDDDDDEPEVLPPPPVAPSLPAPTAYAPAPARALTSAFIPVAHIRKARDLQYAPAPTAPAVAPVALPDAMQSPPQPLAEPLNNPFVSRDAWKKAVAPKPVPLQPSPALPAPAPSTQPQALSVLPSNNTASTGDPDTSSPQAMLGGGAGDADDEAARQQALRDAAANNKYARSQGAQMEITPTGQTQQARDAAGNPLYKARVTKPFVVGDDGEAYRESLDEHNQVHRFRLADGAEGADYHVDPHSGEMYVQTAGDDGQSRRHVIGQNHFVSTAQSVFELQKAHHADAQSAISAVDEAEHGVAGVEGYGGFSLAELRQQRTAVASTLTGAQRDISDGREYMAQGNVLDGPQKRRFDAALATVQEYGGTYQDLDGEITAREGAKTAAEQQRSTSMRAMQDAAGFRNLLSNPRGQMRVRGDLAAVLSGQPIDEELARRYTGAGFLESDGEDGYQLSERGLAVMPRPVRERVQATQVQQGAQAVQKRAVTAHPLLGVPGSPENVAFLHAFSRNGGDAAGALQAVYGR